jgi:hypothetical protein
MSLSCPVVGADRKNFGLSENSFHLNELYYTFNQSILDVHASTQGTLHDLTQSDP